MEGKTVIVTGCNSGIGRETARDLAKRGARIIMACRNVEAATKLKDELVKETNNAQLLVRKLDLSSLESVRDFAKQINREERHLDVLIHNAGRGEIFSKEVSVDGIEMTMATNHFGPFLLTHLLIDLLKRSSPSRVIVVSSEFHRFGRLNLSNLNPTFFFAFYMYCVSKYANVVFTLELARRLEGTGVTANCLHPGIVNTGICRNFPPPFSWILGLFRRLLMTPEQGAQTTIHLAVAEELKTVSGKYFINSKERRLSCRLNNQAEAKKFWELCENIVKLQPDDPKI